MNGDRCRHVFGGKSCGYVPMGAGFAVAYHECDKTFEACKNRERAENFGGYGGFPPVFPSIECDPDILPAALRDIEPGEIKPGAAVYLTPDGEAFVPLPRNPAIDYGVALEDIPAKGVGSVRFYPPDPTPPENVDTCGRCGTQDAVSKMVDHVCPSPFRDWISKPLRSPMLGEVERFVLSGAEHHLFPHIAVLILSLAAFIACAWAGLPL